MASILDKSYLKQIGVVAWRYGLFDHANLKQFNIAQITKYRRSFTLISIIISLGIAWLVTMMSSCLDIAMGGYKGQHSAKYTVYMAYM